MPVTTLEEWFGGSARVNRVGTSAELPSPAPIRRVGVVGAGVMGSGLAQWAAAHGFEVVLRDVGIEALERGLAVVRRIFDEAVRRGKLTAGDANSGLHRIRTTTEWEGFAGCDLVIEAIVENARAKEALFAEIAAVVPPAAILASNSSALPIEEIAGHVPNPARTIGIHFFNPVSRMSLVELVIGTETSRENAERALTFVKALGKAPLLCRSSPGFLTTRVLFFYLNEAVRLREAGESTEAIDGAMRDFGWPMGPLRLIDEVGVDVTDLIFRELEHYFPERFERSPLCERMAAANLLGRKKGRGCGFYRYEDEAEHVNEEIVPRLTPRTTGKAREGGGVPREDRVIVRDLMRVMVEEAQRSLDEGVVKSADDVDFALLHGAGFPKSRGGLMQWARSGAMGS